jgi:hypothetical protein
VKTLGKDRVATATLATWKKKSTTVVTFSLYYKSLYLYVRVASLVYFYGWFLRRNPRRAPIGQRAGVAAAAV